MQPTDHVVMSWCELTLRCVDRVGISEMPGKTVRHSRYFYTAITSTSDHERGDDSWWPIDCTAIDIYISTFYPRLSDNIRLPSASPDCRHCCKVWHFSRYISLAIWIHSALSLVSVAPRHVATRTRYKVTMKSLVVQPPSIPLCYTHTIYDLTTIVLVLEQGYLCVLLAACPQIFFCCHYYYYKDWSL